MEGRARVVLLLTDAQNSSCIHAEVGTQHAWELWRHQEVGCWWAAGGLLVGIRYAVSQMSSALVDVAGTGSSGRHMGVRCEVPDEPATCSVQPVRHLEI